MYLGKPITIFWRQNAADPADDQLYWQLTPWHPQRPYNSDLLLFEDQQGKLVGVKRDRIERYTSYRFPTLTPYGVMANGR